MLLRRAAVVLAVLALVAPALPAQAHEGDPRLVTELERVEPGLPAPVVVQVQPSLAAQLVADNPTPTPLEVLDDDGRPFLRLSAAGVEADVTSPAFLATSSPSGVVPGSAAGAPSQWRTINAGTSWGWFDHRLHPEQLQPPADETRPAELASWTVPLRYGERAVEVSGTVRFAPLLGSFVPSADPAPAGLTVQALPGRLPGLLVAPPPGRTLEVLGVTGEPFLRFTPQGLQVNEASATHVEDRRARGLPAGVPSAEPRFTPPDPAATSWTWLDRRLRYPDDLPPPEVLRRAEPAVVRTWEVPVVLDGAPAVLTGPVRWLPQAGAAPEREADGRSLLPVLVGAAAVVLVGAVLLLRRRRVR